MPMPYRRMKSALKWMIVSAAIYIVISLIMFLHIDSIAVRTVLLSPLSPVSRFVDYGKGISCAVFLDQLHELFIDAKLHVDAHAPVVDIVITVKTNVNTHHQCSPRSWRQRKPKRCLSGYQGHIHRVSFSIS